MRPVAGGDVIEATESPIAALRLVDFGFNEQGLEPSHGQVGNGRDAQHQAEDDSTGDAQEGLLRHPVITAHSHEPVVAADGALAHRVLPSPVGANSFILAKAVMTQ